ncbi:UNVERIFIED_CONTAM: hypothetical protein PYX00_007698 [Menopon gallinae]|uniref:polyribonucleotide nucleotidyltransferase n=1 Tax=Menopon gallinae TaxID=328185 RepID=A0AAW2HK79_9NEOP
MASALCCGRFAAGNRLIRIKNRLNVIICQRYVQTEEVAELVPARTRDSSDYRRSIKITCGKYAKLADFCAVAECGGTSVMAVVVGKGQPTDLQTPLSVNYVQKSSAIGKIPSNFLRRELGQTDREILISRVVDRSLRPLFYPGYAIETQISCQPMALDGDNFPDVLAINAASTALACSNIPWGGPVAAVRVGLIDKKVVINPTKTELAESEVNLIITAMEKENIVMLEGTFNNLVLPEVLMCINTGIKKTKAILDVIERLQSKCLSEKRKITPFLIPEDVEEKIQTHANDQLGTILKDASHNKTSRDEAIQEVLNSCIEKLREDIPDISDEVIKSAFFKNLKQLYRTIVIETGKRCDGRDLSEIRPIHSEARLYEALHGSSVFQRGQTQVFCTVALDSPSSAMRMDDVTRLSSGVRKKNFFVHYEFPAYATNEIGSRRSRNRREVGHGVLAENSLKGAIPENIPFSVRLTSEVLESNGSSSMATVCGGTMALLDAGIPLNFDVAGVAMGLITNSIPEKIEDYHVLTDIMGFEDYIGDMDFKIAGTKTGFTAFQLDVKCRGLPKEVIFLSLGNAKKAISSILKSMHNVISEPRADSKENWPVIEELVIQPHLRTKFVGFGRSNIKNLEMELGVELSETEFGKYSVFAPNKNVMSEFRQRVDEILVSLEEPELEFGGIYPATVIEVKDSGCLVKLYPTMVPTFISLSQLDSRKVSHPSALGFTVGSEFKVKYFGRDPATGAMRLSRKILLLSENEAKV